MNNYSAIIIGIDDYLDFGHLKYAKQDAISLENFLVEEVGFAPERCLRLTATSAQVDSHSTIPNRQNILSRIDDVCRHQLQAQDMLWFFFSGYGASWRGEDYLMPIDGNAGDIRGTGISVRSLFTMLKSSAGEPVAVLLDIKRAIGSRDEEEFGVDTAKLASEMEIPTVLSCQPNQSSGETLALQQGFFTAALLEGLRAGECRTLNNLEKFLRDRLPQLCEQNSHSRQDPLFAVNPPAKLNQIILPELPRSLNAQLIANRNSVAAKELPSLTTNSLLESNDLTPVSGNGKAAVNANAIAADVPLPLPSEETTAPLPDEPKATPDEETDNKGTWVGKLAIGIIYATTVWLVAMLGIFSYNTVQYLRQKSPEKSAHPQTSSQQAKANEREKLNKANLLLSAAPANKFSQAIASAKQIPSDDPLYEQAQKKIDRWAMVIVDIAMGQAERKQYEAAIATANLVPKDRPEAYAKVQELLPTWQKHYQQAVANKQRLQEAKKLIKSGQPSSYSQAIAAVDKISRDRPYYREARASIEQWSDNIWAIAQNQAKRGRIKDAIQTAALVPKDSKAYPAAQQALKQWQRQP